MKERGGPVRNSAQQTTHAHVRLAPQRPQTACMEGGGGEQAQEEERSDAPPDSLSQAVSQPAGRPGTQATNQPGQCGLPRLARLLACSRVGRRTNRPVSQRAGGKPKVAPADDIQRRVRSARRSPPPQPAPTDPGHALPGSRTPRQYPHLCKAIALLPSPLFNNTPSFLH